MTRPVDWWPLAEQDPVGGDSYAVGVEARYYSSLADEIRDQAERLRRIAEEDEQRGKVAEQLRHAAAETADKLEHVHGRVATAGEALSSWIAPLETAQRDTLTALWDAQAAAGRMQANQAPAPGTPAPTTEAAKTAEDARAAAYGKAEDDLAAARTRFENAIGARDAAASAIAKRIKDSLNDGLKDSWWDSVSSWVSQHIDVISVVVDALSWIATGLALLSVFIPVLAPFALAFTALALLGHALLAATGNGSWFDVALDVVALATLGMGRVFTSLGKLGELGMATRGAQLDSSAARTLVGLERAGLKQELQTATSTLAKRWLTSSGRAAARELRTFDDVTAGLQNQAELAARLRALAEMDPETSALDRLAAGYDEETASLAKYLAEHADRWTGDATVDAYRRLAGTGAAAARAMNWSSVFVDMGNHLAGHSALFPAKPSIAGFDHFKDREGERMQHRFSLPLDYAP